MLSETIHHALQGGDERQLLSLPSHWLEIENNPSLLAAYSTCKIALLLTTGRGHWYIPFQSQIFIACSMKINKNLGIGKTGYEATCGVISGLGIGSHYTFP